MGFNILPIILLCETWLKLLDSCTLFPLFSEYTIYRSDREKGFGGVAIMIPRNIPSMSKRKIVQCGDFESVWCRLSVGNKNIDVGMIYRPPRPHSNRMPGKLIDHIVSYFDMSVPTIIGGDFNYGGIDWSKNFAPNQNGQNL